MIIRNDFTLSVDELAGRWTESALCLLYGAGIQPISVDLEVETWRTLEQVLRAEVGVRNSFHLSSATSLNRLKERVIRKTARLIARQFGFSADFSEADSVGSSRSRRTDFIPGLRSRAFSIAH